MKHFRLISNEFVRNVKKAKEISINPLKVLKKSRILKEQFQICPHCNKEIGEKEVFYDMNGIYGTKNVWYHRSCSKPISFESIEDKNVNLLNYDIEAFMNQLGNISSDIDENTVSKNEDSKLKGFVIDIEKETIKNNYFRKVIYTGANSQLVLMSLKPKEDIGEEVHNVDQFFRIDSGTGKIIINGKEQIVSDGFAIVIPASAKHNLINIGNEDLKLYSIYSPPHHKDGVIHVTKQDAINDNEHFDGVISE